ncbi:MAG: L,D-transpeptidase [Rhizobiaceae bacterium]|nr:L,D-transpeptidase [Rhizobiaceae bacterium]MCV0408328.1 L,D-transpeptidase [Rhizobiaceae bacterium]
MDRHTGEIIAVEPPRRARREGGVALGGDGVVRRAPQPRERFGGSYNMNDPEDRARFLRDREILLGRREPPGVDDYEPRDDYREPGFSRRTYEEPVYPDYEERAYPPLDGENLARPERPAGPSGERGITRRPLGEPDSDTASIMEPAEPERDAETPRITVDPLVIPDMHGSGASEDVAAIQILLDRAGASPGVIDGRMGDNVNKAISAYRDMKGQALRTYDKEFIKSELERTGGPAFTEYTITAEDAAHNFVASIPEDYGQKATLERMAYTSVAEMLAERFHMDEKYLRALNPGADFARPGTILKVANTGKNLEGEVGRIVADKKNKQVRVYAPDGRQIAAYPATIGSVTTPSPSGTHEVKRVAFDPEYTYNPKINFKQGNNDKVLTIPPGPNGPVGSIWIALSKPTYGIHGTPDPSKIGKTESNGCVRLTNWDATELAKMVKPGATVEFIE